MTIVFYSEGDCIGDSFSPKNLTYAQDLIPSTSFKSFRISRGLKDDEQLDLSILGQDPSQDHIWSCGKFIACYVGEYEAGCFNAEARCIRLWHH